MKKQIFEKLISIFPSREESLSYTDLLMDFINKLPPGSRFHYIGFMQVRQLYEIRFLAKIPLEEIIPYLQRIYWTGDYSELGKFLNKIALFIDYIVLGLNISGQTLEKIVFECVFRNYFIQDIFVWESVLNYLWDKCGSLEWKPLLDPEETMPMQRQKPLANEKKDKPSYKTINWGVNHVKISQEPGKKMNAEIHYFKKKMSSPRNDFFDFCENLNSDSERRENLTVSAR